MGRAIPQATILAILLTLLPIFSQTMARSKTDNEKSLVETQTHIKEFEAEMEPERLREAYQALENVILLQESDPKSRAQLRTTTLSLWLRLIQLLERFSDPRFDVKDVPVLGVQPPPTPGGVVYPPGADPALIEDPVARAEYEKAITTNRAKTEQYRLQVHLHRLDEPITQRAEAFIRDAYTFTPSDREEAKAAILKTIKNPQRQAGLLKACYELD
ncbi:MAG: hypothetical protein PHE55_03225 [Methylococcaceae bacterium]|nr:hypothetical protein [Methylococcaceae bacterium]